MWRSTLHCMSPRYFVRSWWTISVPLRDRHARHECRRRDKEKKKRKQLKSQRAEGRLSGIAQSCLKLGPSPGDWHLKVWLAPYLHFQLINFTMQIVWTRIVE